MVKERVVMKNVAAKRRSRDTDARAVFDFFSRGKDKAIFNLISLLSCDKYSRKCYIPPIDS